MALSRSAPEARECAHRGLQHPQPGQQAAGRDRSVPFRLPTAQLHQQSLECLRLGVVSPCSTTQNACTRQSDQQLDQQPMAVKLQPALQLPAGTLEQLVHPLSIRQRK